MGIRNTQAILNQYIAVQNDLLTGKVASYSIGDRNFTLQNMSELETIIQRLESAVFAADGPIKADLSEGTVSAQATVW